MYTRIASLTLIGLTACVLIAHAEPPPSYRLTQIGPVPVNGVGMTYVGDINEKGELVAAVQTPNSLEITVWRNGNTTVIGETFDARGINVGINDLSMVVATLFNPQSGSDEAFRWRRGILDALGSPSPTSAFFPYEINNAGQILGHTFDDATFTSQTYLRQRNGYFKLLETLPGAYSMFPVDLNDRGVALGFGESVSDGRSFVDCVIWRESTVERLDTGPDRFCIPGDINAHNQVVGSATLDGMSRGFIWENGHTEALPLIHPGEDLGNSAGGINNKGWIAGTTFDSQGEARATIWRAGIAYDLNTLVATDDPLRPYITLYAAGLINERGWVVALGLDSRREGGGSSPYLLTPAH